MEKAESVARIPRHEQTIKQIIKGKQHEQKTNTH